MARGDALGKEGESESPPESSGSLELFGEGTRFQDLLRWGEGAKMANNGKAYPLLQVNGQVVWESCGNPSYGFKAGKNEKLPYPAAEIRLNSNIVQNPGY